MNYNPETHCVVPFPELPSHIAKGNLGVCYYDAMQMHQYAMRYANLVIAAAPQPQQSVEPIGEVKLHTGSLKDMAVIVWVGEQPPVGTKLYVAPPNLAEIQAKAIEAAAHEGWMAANEACEDRVRSAIRELAEKVLKGEVKL